MKSLAWVVQGPQQITGFFQDRFGIGEQVLEGYSYLESGKNVWALRGVRDVTAYVALKQFQYAGIHILRKVNGAFKPTSYGLQVFGRDATRNRIELRRVEFQTLVQDRPITKYFDVEPGYVLLSYRGSPLGCGIYKDGNLVHSFPKGRSTALAGSGLY